MKPIAWIAVSALAVWGLAAGLRRPVPEAPAVVKRAVPVPAVPAAVPADPARRTAERLRIRSDEVDAFVAVSREVARELRRLQIQRQSEWDVEVDPQTRLEWEERYDADRQAATASLERFLDGGEAHRAFRDQIDTWAATVWAREQGVYR